MFRQLVAPVSYHHTDLDDTVDRIGILAPLVEPLKLLMSDASVPDELVSDKHLLAMLAETQALLGSRYRAVPTLPAPKLEADLGAHWQT